LDLSRTTPVPANEAIPTMDFFRWATLHEPSLNRAGTHVVAISSDENADEQLLLYDVETHKVDGVNNAWVRSATWLGDKRLLIDIGGQLEATDIAQLTAFRPMLDYCNAALVCVPERNPLRPIVWIRSGSLQQGRTGDIVALNTDLGEIIGLTSPKGSVGWSENNERHIAETYPVLPVGIGSGYLADKEGELAFGFASQDGVLAMYRLAGQRWEKCPVDLESTDVLDCGDKPGELVVCAAAVTGQPRALQFMDAATGKLGEVLLQDNAYDVVSELYRDPISHDIVGATYERNGPKVAWFSDAYRSVQKILNGYFPDLVTRIIGNDRSGRRFLVCTYSDCQPAIYYLLELDKRAVELFKRSRPWIDPKRMQPMSILKYKTRDGRELDAYATLPVGASRKNPAPLVVLPHDGPWVRNTWGFDEYVQFLASRGYAVLQPNYRGSPGYGWMFPAEDEWAFGKMSDDVTDATKTLIASGLVDGKRVAIVGWGFGAYLAVAGVANEPDLYRCGAAIAGVFDWGQMIKEERYFQFSSPRYDRFLRKLGDPKKGKDKLDALSPIRHVDRIRAPVFVAEYKEESGTLMAQARMLEKELEKYHVPHEFVLPARRTIDRVGLENDVEFVERLEAFIAKNLMPAPASFAAPQQP
jgi:acetyl esterase/lipase